MDAAVLMLNSDHHSMYILLYIANFQSWQIGRDIYSLITFGGTQGTDAFM